MRKDCIRAGSAEGSRRKQWPDTSIQAPSRRSVTARTSAPAAAVARRALAPGGTLRLATDWEDYALHMREVLDEAPGFERAFPGEWAERFPGRVLTAFERKGERAGRAIRDLTYRVTENAGG